MVFHSEESGVTLAMRNIGQGQGSTSIPGLQCDPALMLRFLISCPRKIAFSAETRLEHRLG